VVASRQVVEGNNIDGLQGAALGSEGMDDGLSHGFLVDALAGVQDAVPKALDQGVYPVLHAATRCWSMRTGNQGVLCTLAQQCTCTLHENKQSTGYSHAMGRWGCTHTTSRLHTTVVAVGRMHGTAGPSVIDAVMGGCQARDPARYSQECFGWSKDECNKDAVLAARCRSYATVHQASPMQLVSSGRSCQVVASVDPSPEMRPAPRSSRLHSAVIFFGDSANSNDHHVPPASSLA
jgi:hypothetical protein